MTPSDRARADTNLAWLLVGAGAVLTLLIGYFLLGFVARQVNGWAAAQYRLAGEQAAERRRIAKTAEPSDASDEPLPVAQGPAPPNDARPLGQVTDWVGPGDYPPSAMRAGYEGRVRVTVAVDRAGTPTGCAVRRSSGHWSLDNATCAGMLNRGRFDVALRGPRVRHWTSPAIRWVLPERPPGTGPMR